MMATLPLIILLVLFVIGFPIGFALMLCVVPYFALAAGDGCHYSALYRIH